jgi:2-oxo-3-hexenedioate decarboxylase
MTSAELQTLANQLLKTRGVNEARPSDSVGLTLEDAYQVAHLLAGAQTRPLTGRKIGISNRASWDKLGLSDIVWGYVFEDTVHDAPDNTFELALDSFVQPRLEPEIVFGLKAPLPQGTRDPAALLHAVSWMALGFEVVQCPYPDWQFKPADLVATFGFHGALIVGQKVTLEDHLAELGMQLADTEATLYKNDEVLLSGGGRNVVDSPAVALGHLADLIAADPDATPLAAGELITTGTLTGAPDVAAGETYRVQVTGLGLPELTLRLV